LYILSGLFTSVYRQTYKLIAAITIGYRKQAETNWVILHSRKVVVYLFYKIKKTKV